MEGAGFIRAHSEKVVLRTNIFAEDNNQANEKNENQEDDKGENDDDEDDHTQNDNGVKQLILGAPKTVTVMT